jgi:hypothetical protein
MSNEEETRRQNERNMFSAFALGGADESSFANSLETIPEAATVARALGTASTVPSDEPYGSSQARQDSFFHLNANAPADSGTFQFSAPANDAFADSSSLEAAAASFSTNDEDEPCNLTSSASSFNEVKSPSKPPPTPTTDHHAPMFCEQVVLPRPLFFGSILPPRIFHQGRAMVQPYVKNQNLPIPPGVRNFIGAIRAYGYGLEHLLESDSINDKNEYWRGDPTVSTYQPVTGEAARDERVRQFTRNNLSAKPSVVARSVTAPSKLQENSATDPCGEDEPEATNKVNKDGTNNDIGTKMKDPIRSSQNNLFSQWLRSDAGIEDTSDVLSVGSLHSTQSLDNELITSSNNIVTTPDEQRALTEAEIFSKWANGSDSMQIISGTMLPNTGKLDSSRKDRFAGSTFQRIPNITNNANDDDDDSLVDDELKKKVGLSDHLSKAIASLTDDGVPTDFVGVDESHNLLSQQHATELSICARPLTNYELTNGRVPLFGLDDSPVPVEGDLGLHDTKDEQQRSHERKRSQEMIEKFVGPNIFGCIACPNPALNPDDFHSWNSRASLGQPRNTTSGTLLSEKSSGQLRYGSVSSASVAGGHSPSVDSKQTAQTKQQQQQTTPLQSSKQYDTRGRFGWWNVNEMDAKMGDSKKATDDLAEESSKQTLELPLQLPPFHHSSSTLPVISVLEPTPSELRDANLPLSRMHAATSMSQTLPYLSDRPPSYRYLQIDTQAVGFPPMGGEVEPLFCSIAIYNIETVSSGVIGDHGAAPVPDLQRCGRVTEALNFDLVNDKEISKRCRQALWPYSRTNIVPDSDDDGQMQGSRCGVFPVPSNLSVSNLYAVLVVRKVLAESTEFDPYLKPGWTNIDIPKLRARAEKCSNQYGQFLVPFVFGVAPLHQVFGSENPVVASSRAVQIPLFRFLGGERNIIDHIMVMLYPR